MVGTGLWGGEEVGDRTGFLNTWARLRTGDFKSLGQMLKGLLMDIYRNSTCRRQVIIHMDQFCLWPRILAVEQTELPRRSPFVGCTDV